MKVNDVKWLKVLVLENQRMERIAADEALNIYILKEVNREFFSPTRGRAEVN